jgi:hypothetical protein
MKAITIQMNTIFPAFISSRESINLLKNSHSFNSLENYIFNFKGVAFVSRSFTDEFLKFTKDNNLSFELTSRNSDVKKMFEAVQKTQTPIERHFDPITITTFKQGARLDCLLATF